MGKSKKRILHKTNSLLYMTRENAVSTISNSISKSKFNQREKIENLVSLFGISAEELSEAGVGYEYLKSLEGIMN